MMSMHPGRKGKMAGRSSTRSSMKRASLMGRRVKYSSRCSRGRGRSMTRRRRQKQHAAGGSVRVQTAAAVRTRAMCRSVTMCEARCPFLRVCFCLLWRDYLLMMIIILYQVAKRRARRRAQAGQSTMARSTRHLLLPLLQPLSRLSQLSQNPRWTPSPPCLCLAVTRPLSLPLHSLCLWRNQHLLR